MGIFRFFLALTILIGHAHYEQYIPNDILPYVTSGFYCGAAKIHCFFPYFRFFFGHAAEPTALGCPALC